ncbi:hypothetical protein B1R32_105131 [Abditibacterium utsteinense]|uniref:DUF3592 domain-containing protein n=1 Tax=Abditibacterium utsteinense TaxID=1960156 RepID=A0A2S8SUL1_9BACT|nr:hypothetical protein [Abditibacterium utsteinense]PQV64449.1 hypothetical protein B1R32_105131 [Abditibacterium utsteinense]
MIEEFDGDINWSEIENRWQPEVELRQQMPRRIESRGEKRGCGGRASGCFLGGMMSFMFGLGLMLSFWGGLALLILPFGSDTTGTVTRHEISQSNSRRSGFNENYFLLFRFRPHGSAQNYSGEWPVSERIYLKRRDGEEIAVRYFAPLPGVRPMLPEGASPWFYVWFLGPLGLLMLGVSGVYLLAVLSPKRGKRLVRRGVVTPAIVTRRDPDKSEVTYLFRADGKTIEKSQKMNSNQLSAPPVGTILTTLHHPKCPQNAALYRFCDFIARAPN